jgi:hypothetical protein
MGSRNQKKRREDASNYKVCKWTRKTEKMPGHVSAHQYTRLILDCAVWHGCVVPTELPRSRQQAVVDLQ